MVLKRLVFGVVFVASFFHHSLMAEVKVKLKIALKEYPAPEFHYPYFDEMNGYQDFVKVLFKIDEEGYVEEYSIQNQYVEKDLRQSIRSYLFSKQTRFKDKPNRFGFLSIKYRFSENIDYHNLIRSYHDFFDEGNYKLAYQSIIEGMKLEPNNPASHYLLAMVLKKLDRIEDSKPHYQKAIDLSPDNPLPYYSLAFIYKKEGNTELAGQYLDSSIERAPKFWENYWLKSDIAQAQGRYLDAMNHLAYALELNPDSEYLHSEKGWLLLDQEAYLLAKQSFEKALEYNSEYQTALSGLSRSLYDLELYEQAKEYSLKALALSPEDTYDLFQAGLIFDELKEYDKAAQYLFELISIDKAYPSALNNLGYLYIKMGELEKAEKTLLQALELTPKASRVINNLGTVKFQQGDCSNANEYFNRIEALYPGHENSFSEVYLARCAIQLNDLERAYALLMGVVDENPDYFDALYIDQFGSGNHLKVAIDEYVERVGSGNTNAKTLINAYKETNND